MNSLLTEPVWQIGADRAELLTEAAVSNYTEDVITFGFLRQGHVLLNELWQKNMGEGINIENLVGKYLLHSSKFVDGWGGGGGKTSNYRYLVSSRYYPKYEIPSHRMVHSGDM